jgi:hypothetical protein
MGNWPDKTETAPENPAPGSRERLNLFVSFVLNVLAGVFHVFTKPMRGVATGENNLADNGDQ